MRRTISIAFLAVLCAAAVPAQVTIVKGVPSLGLARTMNNNDNCVALTADGSRVVIAFNDDRSGNNDTYVVVDKNSGADILGGTQAEHYIGLRQGIWVAARPLARL